MYEQSGLLLQRGRVQQTVTTESTEEFGLLCVKCLCDRFLDNHSFGFGMTIINQVETSCDSKVCINRLTASFLPTVRASLCSS